MDFQRISCFISYPKLASNSLLLSSHLDASSFVVEEKTLHSIWAKKDSSKGGSKGRTLFCINCKFLPLCLRQVPIIAAREEGEEQEEEELRHFFSGCGDVEEIIMMKQRRTCQITFKDEESIEMCLEKKEETETWPQITLTGLEKWIKQSARPDIQMLKEKVDQAMSLFEDEEKKKRMDQEAKYNMPDEDGFVTVMKRGRKNNLDSAGGSVGALSKEDAEKLKPKEHLVVDFYRFQMREKKRQGILGSCNGRFG